MSVQEIDTASFTQEWLDWHRHHEEVLADPHGFLAITALHWLTADRQRFDDVPGTWSTGEHGVTVVLDDTEELLVDGAPVHGEYGFGVIPERGGVTATFGEAVVEVAKRGGHDIIRPRHPEHPTRVGFSGTPAYAPRQDWAVDGHYVPFDEPRQVTVGAAVEGLQHVYEAPGQVVFDLDGQHLSLTAFNGHAPGSLFLLFTDATSGVTTYAANRALQVSAPDEQGGVTLDFNRATNLPCAYTEFATCPLPPAENRLPVAIEAGEQTPHGHQ